MNEQTRAAIEAAATLKKLRGDAAAGAIVPPSTIEYLVNELIERVLGLDTDANDRSA